MGNNKFGQLGDNTTTQRTIPTQNALQGKVLHITAGGTYMLAIVGNVTYSWGDNSRGQTGQGNNAMNLVPTAITVPYQPTPIAVIGTSDVAYSSNPGTGGSSYLLVEGILCFGVFKDNAKVCSTNGICVAQDTCICQPYYYGPDCSNYNCYNVCFNLYY
jgi:hypothetical protein